MNKFCILFIEQALIDEDEDADVTMEGWYWFLMREKGERHGRMHGPFGTIKEAMSDAHAHHDAASVPDHEKAVL